MHLRGDPSREDCTDPVEPGVDAYGKGELAWPPGVCGAEEGMFDDGPYGRGLEANLVQPMAQPPESKQTQQHPQQQNKAAQSGEGQLKLADSAKSQTSTHTHTHTHSQAHTHAPLSPLEDGFWSLLLLFPRRLCRAVEDDGGRRGDDGVDDDEEDMAAARPVQKRHSKQAIKRERLRERKEAEGRSSGGVQCFELPHQAKLPHLADTYA